MGQTNNAPEQKWSAIDITAVFLAFSFVIFINGAIPFLMTPTLGQAVWSMGFSQSFANGPLLDFYAHDFGVPRSAPIAFGLAVAWPAGILIRIGLHAADAYSSMVILWMGVAFFSAYQIARLFGSTRNVALLGASAWLTLPIVWAHSDYSMLSVGIALLPFYFLGALRLFCLNTDFLPSSKKTIFIYLATTIVSVFMDGYTFMMFASGSTILLIYQFITRKSLRKILLKIALPVHVASFSVSYFLYISYIGGRNFEAHSLDFFRGWGLDLSFIAIPTKGLLWLPDIFGLSLSRSDEIYFGDGSVWNTTFSLPIISIGILAWWLSRKEKSISSGLLVVAIFGFYMALGPSLKINSTKPETLQISHPKQVSALMAKEFAVTPTGNAWISESLPGFNAMRASYRWLALCVFGMWLLIMLQASRRDTTAQLMWSLCLVSLILLSLPDPQYRWKTGTNNRHMFLQIDTDLVAELRNHVNPSETVIFIPWGNDFFANYLAPRSGFHTPNIGGDKNLQMAQVAWPPEIMALGNKVTSDNLPIAINLLTNGSADVLIFPYFDMLWSAHGWPCFDRDGTKMRAAIKDNSSYLADNSCIDAGRTESGKTLALLRKLSHLTVKDSAFFATVRLKQ